MNEYELRGWVETMADAEKPELSRWSLREAFREYVNDERPRQDFERREARREAGLILARAREIEENRRTIEEPKAESLKQPADLESPEWLAFTARQRLKTIGAWIDEVRATIQESAGGDPTLPCRSVRAAVKWIEGAGRLGESQDVEERAGHKLLLLYADPRLERVRKILVHPDSPVAPLARAVPEMAMATGFEPALLTIHVLTGREFFDGWPLFLPPLDVKATTSGYRVPVTGAEILRGDVVVTFRSPPRTRDLDEVRRLIASKLEGAARSGGSKDRALIKAVRIAGGPPPRGRGGPRWPELWKALDEEGWSFPSHGALNRAYRRAVDRTRP